MPTDNRTENSSKKALDDPNTLHEQLKKLKEDVEKNLEDSSKSIKNIDDINNPIHGYCS